MMYKFVSVLLTVRCFSMHSYCPSSVQILCFFFIFQHTITICTIQEMI